MKPANTTASPRSRCSRRSEKYWPVFFGKVKDCLKAGGTAGMQIITINESAYPTYRKRPDFIQRYVFPGGMLPTPAILKSLGADQGLSPICASASFRRTMPAHLPNGASVSGAPVGEDRSASASTTASRRLWEFYLHYCEAGIPRRVHRRAGR